MDELTEREGDVKFLRGRIDALLRANNAEVNRRRAAEQKAEHIEDRAAGLNMMIDYLRSERDSERDASANALNVFVEGLREKALAKRRELNGNPKTEGEYLGLQEAIKEFEQLAERLKSSLFGW